MKPYKYDPENTFESIINLTGLLQDAKDGNFENLGEIRKEFNEILRSVHHTQRLCNKAFLKQSTCECEDFTQPRWSLRKNILNYYYHFEKKCSNCGKVHFTRLDSWDMKIFPEGYEGAEKEFYNLDI